MKWRWRWLWRRRHVNGEAAQARLDAEQRLRDARRDWPRVYDARDLFAEMMEAAMRGRRAR